MRLPTDAEPSTRPFQNSIPAHPNPYCAARQLSRCEALFWPHATIKTNWKLKENWAVLDVILHCGKVPYSPTLLSAISEPSKPLGRLPIVVLPGTLKMDFKVPHGVACQSALIKTI